MPGFDGTGPLGLGPMTGRGRGYCIVPLGNLPGAFSYPVKGNFLRYGRLGRGFGRGGFGYRNWFWATGLPGWMRTSYSYPALGGWVDVSEEEDVEMLEEQAKMLRQELEEIQNKITKLKEKGK
jgi:hypothetical protein